MRDTFKLLVSVANKDCVMCGSIQTTRSNVFAKAEMNICHPLTWLEGTGDLN